MPHTPVLTSPVAARDVLTESEAQDRAARVTDVSYDIALDLAAGLSTYKGDVTIRFNTTGSGALFFDFRGKEIDRLEVNGEGLEPDWNGYRLTVRTSNNASRDYTQNLVGISLTYRMQ